MGAFLRWSAKPDAVQPQIGDRRTVTAWLFLPRKVAGQWRWLGREQIIEECMVVPCSIPAPPGIRCMGWRPVEWADG